MAGSQTATSAPHTPRSVPSGTTRFAKQWERVDNFGNVG